MLSRRVKDKIYKTIILLVVSYGCETWFLTLREENRLRVFENRVLRGIHGPKRDGVTGERRKLHDGEFHHQISLDRLNQGELGRRGMWHEWERSVEGFGGKARRKDTTWKIKA
jgi:hypothetical protein